jgi:hypothetical protein
MFFQEITFWPSGNSGYCDSIEEKSLYRIISVSLLNHRCACEKILLHYTKEGETQKETVLIESSAIIFLRKIFSCLFFNTI